MLDYHRKRKRDPSRWQRNDTGSQSRVDRSLYEEVARGPGEEKQKCIEVGMHVKIGGLQNAKQYNGRTGVVIDQDKVTGKYGVELEKDKKQIKVKAENLEVLESFGGLKGGFLGSEKSSEQPKQREDDGIEVIKPQPRKDGVLDGLKSIQMQNKDVPEWMQANEDLLHEVESDAELASAVNNQKLITAIDEIAKDPSAWSKYQHDEEVKKYFAKMMGLFGKRYEKYEEQTNAKEKKEKSSKTSVVEELLCQDAKPNLHTAGKSLIQEINVRKANCGVVVVTSCARVTAQMLQRRRQLRNATQVDDDNDMIMTMMNHDGGGEVGGERWN
eukprot:768695-Hanusia_phi.AAC.4